MLRKLKVYPGPDHPHQAQQPTPFKITQVAQPAAAVTGAASVQAESARSASGARRRSSGDAKS
jgi:hypothetical protein